MKAKAKLIVFEGVDQLGKSTQAKMLYDHLNHNHKVFFAKAPFQQNTRLHKLIYWMLGNGSATKYTNLFQILQFTDKLLFNYCYLKKAMRENDYVLLDRWKLSALVYGQATSASRLLCDIFFNLLIDPDLTIVFEGEKIQRGAVQDEYEKNKRIQTLAKSFYNYYAKIFSNHSIVSNCDEFGVRSRDSIFSDILNRLKKC